MWLGGAKDRERRWGRFEDDHSAASRVPAWLSFLPTFLSLTNLPPLFSLLLFPRSADAYILQLTFPTTTLFQRDLPSSGPQLPDGFLAFLASLIVEGPITVRALALNLLVKFRHRQLAVFGRAGR